MPSVLTSTIVRWGVGALLLAATAGAWQLERAWRQRAETRESVARRDRDEAARANETLADRLRLERANADL